LVRGGVVFLQGVFTFCGAQTWCFGWYNVVKLWCFVWLEVQEKAGGKMRQLFQLNFRLVDFF